MSAARRGRRALLAFGVVVACALLAALAVWLVANTRFDLSSARGEDGAFAVETELPAATCRKVLTADFPWVRFACEARDGDGGSAAEGAADGGGAAPPVAPAAP